MEIDNYEELDEFLEQELIFKDGNLVTKLTKHDLMRLLQHWKVKKLNKPHVSGSLPLTEDLINEAKEILGLSYITKIDKTPEFMKKQIQLLKFTEKVAKMIVGNNR